MPRLNPLPYRVIRKKLIAAGYLEYSQKGSHVKFVRQDDKEVRTVLVPKHSEVTIGTLKSILRQAGLTTVEFNDL